MHVQSWQRVHGPGKWKEGCQEFEEMQVDVEYPASANHAEMGAVRPDLQDVDLYVLLHSQDKVTNHDILHTVAPRSSYSQYSWAEAALRPSATNTSSSKGQ